MVDFHRKCAKKCFCENARIEISHIFRFYQKYGITIKNKGKYGKIRIIQLIRIKRKTKYVKNTKVNGNVKAEKNPLNIGILVTI